VQRVRVRLVAELDPDERSAERGLPAATSRAAARGSKCTMPSVRTTCQPLALANAASSSRSSTSITPDAHDGRGVVLSVHAMRVSAETPPKRSTPGPSERSTVTKSPRSE
jgi:hypothetical protein